MEYRYDANVYLCMMIICSFLGFCLENMWLIVRKGYFDNRNMTLPFLAGYGFTIIGIYFLFGTPVSPGLLTARIMTGAKYGKLKYFLLIFAAVSAGEIVMGKTVEHLCGFYWWDYTEIPMHFSRYTSVPTSTGFSLIICGFMEHIFPVIAEFLDIYKEIIPMQLVHTVFIAVLLDAASSLRKMYRKRGYNDVWRVNVTRKAIAYDNKILVYRKG